MLNRLVVREHGNHRIATASLGNAGDELRAARR